MCETIYFFPHNNLYLQCVSVLSSLAIWLCSVMCSNSAVQWDICAVRQFTQPSDEMYVQYVSIFGSPVRCICSMSEYSAVQWDVCAVCQCSEMYTVQCTHVHLLEHGLQVGGLGPGERSAQVAQIYRVVHHALTLCQHVVQWLPDKHTHIASHSKNLI